MEYVRPFSGLGRLDAGIAGGKGASLGEMTQAGIPVPPGFVVLAQTFDRFLQETDLVQEIDAILHTVEHDEMHTVEHASEKIQALILAAAMPADIAAEIMRAHAELGAEFVAVRSSATAEDGAEHAWAGQLDTHLNTPEGEVLRNVQRCWSSLFTPRAIFYRFEKGLHGTAISVAVVVQKMVQSEISGIAFSVHPVTEDRNQLIIEAGFGLGEAIVSGQVTPDSYVVEKTPRRIIDVNVSEQSRGLFRKEGGGNEWRELGERGKTQVLTEAQILELSALIIHIETHYGFPCDIEWAAVTEGNGGPEGIEGLRFYITQSRPITTLSAVLAPDAVSELVPEALRIEYVKMGRWAMLPADVETWHTAETARAFSDYFGIWKESLAVNVFDAEATYNRMFIPKRFVENLYARISQIAEKDPRALERVLEQFYADKREAHHEVPRIAPRVLGTLSAEELAALYVRNRSWVHRIVAYDQFGWIAEDYWTPRLRATLERYGLIEGTPDYQTALFALIKPREISTTLEEKRAVLAASIAIDDGLSTVEAESRSLMHAFGWMPVLAYGTPWDEAWYRRELESHSTKKVDDLRREHEKLVRYSELRDADFAEIRARYGIQDTDAQLFIDYGLVIDTRNEAEYVNSLCGFHLLPLYAEMSRRLGCSVDDLRTLFEHEIVACLRGEADVPSLIAAKDGAATCAIIGEGTRIELTGREARALADHAETHCTIAGAIEGAAARGVPASPGKAKGRVRIIPDPSQNQRVEEGDILITFATTVDYLPAMKRAAAIVTEVGGLTCHAAVVSREFGIPCVVSYKDAMTLFRDGDLVEVDAGRGIVQAIGSENGIATLRKEYMRDTTITIQESWGRALTRHLREERGWVNPYSPTVVHTFERGSIAIWQDPRATDWIMRMVREYEASHPGWLLGILASLEQRVQSLRSQWELSHLDTAEELQRFVRSIDEMMFDYIPYYYASLDESIPEPLKSKIMAYRETDVIFSSASRLVRDTLVHLYPGCAPYETAILTSEIASPPTSEVLRDRQEHLTIVDGDAILNESLEQFVSHTPGISLVVDTPPESPSLGGTSAYPGIVQGRVFVLFRKAQLAAVPEGAVIVSPMTTPDFMQAMQRAAAFITDEGGITCHAAIVAREMKKPCIIGTKVATQVLKDGDLVEVDAEKGIVTILRPEPGDAMQGGDAVAIDGDDYVLGVTRNMSYWHQCLSSTGHHSFSKDFGLDTPLEKHVFATLDGIHTFVFFNPAQLEEYCAAVLRAVDSEQKIRALKETYAQHAGELLASLDACTKDLTPATLAEFMSRYEKMTAGLTLTAMLGRSGMELLSDDLREAGYGEHEVPGIIATITYPDEHTPLMDAQLGLLAIGADAQAKGASDADMDGELGAWLVRFQHIPVNFCEEPWSLSDARAQLSDVMRGSCADELARLKQVHQEKRAAAADKLAQLGDEKTRILARALAEGTYLNEYRKGVFSMVSLGYRGIFAKLAEKGGSHEWKDCFYLAPHEMLGLARGEKVDIPSIVKERRIAGCKLVAGANVPLSDTELAALEQHISRVTGKTRHPKAVGAREVRGFPANTGTVKGVVRVVLSSSDFAKLGTGEILVTTMTSVDFVPIMHRAAAFVTNEGGITSHAAIVAREMNKPCIIGTKIATQVLKDGDMVEVDAEKGVVRIVGHGGDRAQLIRHISANRWQKDWEGKFSLLNCISCEPYYHDCYDVLGTRTDEILIFHHDGITTCLLSKEGDARFSADLARAIEADERAPEKWALAASREYEILRRFSGMSPGAIFAELPELVRCIKRYSVYLVAMKSVVNALTDRHAERHIETIVRARKETEKFYFEAEKILEQLAAYVGVRTGYATELVESVLVAELLAYAAGAPLPPKAVLQSRRNGCAFHFAERMTEFDGPEARELQQELVGSKSDTLQGVCAYPGNVTGRARVITDYARASHRLAEGEVLVTGMTDPNYLPLMRKAAAILVDTGGLLSHAAISARELKVPCVIGLERATACIADGDLVEVDAEKGVVRKISEETPA